MPRHTHLMERNGRYYLNVRVPKDLLTTYKKEHIRKSLGTSDHSAALDKIRLASLKLHTEFAEARARLRRPALGPPQKIERLSDEDAHRLVVKFFIQEERRHDEWWEKEGRGLPYAERLEAEHAMMGDAEHLCYPTESEDRFWDDGSGYLEKFLTEQHLDLPRDSEAYRKLLPLIRRAKIENLSRTINAFSGGVRTADKDDPMFNRISANTPLPKVRRMVTLAEAIERYTKKLEQAKRTRGTLRTYSVPMRLLRELLGAGTALSSIGEAEGEKLAELLPRIPKNATQRYRGMAIADAIAIADKEGNADRLGPKVLANYWNNISTFFNFAEREGMMARNPARDRYLRASFEVGEERDAPLFTTDELNRLFHAPLYTGCKNDERGYLKVGPNRPKRGRFWLPLIGLFHGMRPNEAGQLETADMKEENGILYFYVREVSEDGSASEKLIKTAQSKRRVPVHPEMLKLGFREFIEERRKDRAEPRLFPELPRSKLGYVSDPFGKWFKRFVQKAVGEDCRATFKSFRHQFRTALFDADVSIPVTEALGGWELMRRSAEKNYLQFKLARLYEEIAKVKYPGLDLSHLYQR
jgi:hypothetical protein